MAMSLREVNEASHWLAFGVGILGISSRCSHKQSV